MAFRRCGRLCLKSTHFSVVPSVSGIIRADFHSQIEQASKQITSYNQQGGHRLELQASSYDFQSRWFRSSPLPQNSVEVEIQSMGESITEGTIAEILKQEGDSVEEDNTIARIETDKVTVDVKSPAAGRLTKLQVSVEDTVKVGQVIAVVSEGTEGVPERSDATKPAEQQKEQHHDPASSKSSSDEASTEEEVPQRKPSIHFPDRMIGGKRISDMTEAERPRQDIQERQDAPPQEKSAATKVPQPKKSQPWYVGKEQGTKLSQSRVLTQKEMEQIELGGADP